MAGQRSANTSGLSSEETSSHNIDIVSVPYVPEVEYDEPE